MEGIPGGLEPGLDAQSFFKPEGRQFPFGVHIAASKIEHETGEIRVTRYIAVDDCGTIINPLLVHGQKHGGLAQGFGQALWEGVVYDEDGQLLTGSLMDYATPRAEQFPNCELDSTVTPSPQTPHGAKGVGEAGTTGSPPALVNAVLDALRPLGVTQSICLCAPSGLASTAERATRAGCGVASDSELFSFAGKAAWRSNDASQTYVRLCRTVALRLVAQRANLLSEVEQVAANREPADGKRGKQIAEIVVHTLILVFRSAGHFPGRRRHPAAA